MNTAPTPARPHLVPVAGGAIAVEEHTPDAPSGLVALCLPSLGDTAAEFRLLAPLLAARGVRVLVMDLRGHGGSTTGFASHGAEDLAADALAVLDALGVPRAVVIGCSVGGAAAIDLAARHPDRVLGVGLLGAIARDLPADRFFRPFAPLVFARPWGPWLWSVFYRSLYKRTKPADLEDYVARLRAHLAEPGRIEAVVGIIRASKAGIAARWSEVRCPAAVVMGTADPDFPDARAEGALLRDTLGGPSTLTLLEGVGHYAHVEGPEATLAALAPLFADQNGASRHEAA